MQICAQCLRQIRTKKFLSRRYLATAAAVVPDAPLPQLTTSSPPIARFPPNQPPSHRPPEFRKSQLHRQYTSLLRSTPLLLLFSHFNLQSREWMSLRRELNIALQKCDEQTQSSLADSIKIQVIKAGIFESALRIVEYYRPPPPTSPPHPSDPETQSSNSTIQNLSFDSNDPGFTHSLSRQAHDSVADMRGKHPLTPLLAGPLAVMSFPEVSPPHLKAALSVLAPDKGAGFPPPTRRAMPGYYDVPVQSGVQKLLLLGARVDGKVIDQFDVRWVGGLEGMAGLRAQLVGLLNAAGAGLVQTLEGAGKSLWLTVESRRTVLEEEEGKGKEA